MVTGCSELVVLIPSLSLHANVNKIDRSYRRIDFLILHLMIHIYFLNYTFNRVLNPVKGVKIQKNTPTFRWLSVCSQIRV
jgi:hypothetical protein